MELCGLEGCGLRRKLENDPEKLHDLAKRKPDIVSDPRGTLLDRLASAEKK
jgi:hypothetical protein